MTLFFAFESIKGRDQPSWARNATDMLDMDSTVCAANRLWRPVQQALKGQRTDDATMVHGTGRLF